MVFVGIDRVGVARVQVEGWMGSSWHSDTSVRSQAVGEYFAWGSENSRNHAQRGVEGVATPSRHLRNESRTITMVPKVQPKSVAKVVGAHCCFICPRHKH